MVAFLGGTIGNLYVEERAAFLGALADTLEPGDTLLLGTDLVKSVDRLIAAYDDAQGVTAEFVTNCLRVLNRELGRRLRPRAPSTTSRSGTRAWSAWTSGCAPRCRSACASPEPDLDLELAAGEEIRVEISTKFRTEGIRRELARRGVLRPGDLDRPGRVTSP